MNSLGQLIRRQRGGRSYREFSRSVGLSPAYLSNLEKGRDPRTGNPIDPTISTLIKLSWGLDMSLFDLLMQAGIVNKKRTRFRRCEFCGRFFKVTHERQRFCPPPLTKKRSTCEMAYNNRLKKALRLYQSGRTLEQIGKQVDRVPIERIKEFIQRREGGK